VAHSTLFSLSGVVALALAFAFDFLKGGRVAHIRRVAHSTLFSLSGVVALALAFAFDFRKVPTLFG
jgi:hypothetical protein